MGFLNAKKEEKDRPEPITKEPAIKANEIKSASGHDSLDSVRESAVASQASPTGPGMRGRPSKNQAANAQAAIEAKHEAEIAESLAKIGEGMMSELASIPYEAWAIIASDPELRLSKDEQKKFADAYFMMAKAIKPDMNRPVVILGYIAILNVRAVAVRLKMLNDKKKAEEETESKEKQRVQ